MLLARCQVCEGGPVLFKALMYAMCLFVVIGAVAIWLRQARARRRDDDGR
jgi:hypothetical protein